MNSHLDPPDEKQAEELNRKYADVDFEIDWELKRRRRNFVIRLLAFLVCLFFILSVLAQNLKVFTMPSLDFIQESHQLTEEPRIQDMQDSVVTLRITGSQELDILPSLRRGTGFNICQSGLIVTNRHLVEHAGGVVVTFLNGKKFSGESWLASKQADLALVNIEGEDLPEVQMEMNNMPEPEEEVTVIGNPLGYNWIAAQGKVSGYRSSGGIEVMEIEAPIHPGSSGSPVFNRDDEVVGVVFASVQSEAATGLTEFTGPTESTEFIEFMDSTEHEVSDDNNKANNTGSNVDENDGDNKNNNQQDRETIKGLAVPLTQLKELLEEADEIDAGFDES